jgi:hypothetical protein
VRAILFLALIVLVLALIGWITFNRDAERPGVNLETQKMKDDTQKALDTGAELLKKAERSLDGSPDKTDQVPETADR